MQNTALRQLSFDIGQANTLDEDFAQILRMVLGSQTGYDTFNLHEYPAKFMPQFPEIFIRHYTQEGQLVVDPMCGSGTTIAAACLQNRSGFGVDIDPIACLIASVATTPLDVNVLTEYRTNLVRAIRRAFERERQVEIVLPSDDDYPNALLWFRPEVLRELLVIRDVILETPVEQAYKNLALLSLSSIVREVSNADPRDIFPERDAAMPVRERKDVFAHFQRALFENSKRVTAFSEKVGYQRRAQVQQGDARKLELDDNSAHLVFTSPPYCYAMDYARVHQLSTLLFIMNNNALREQRRRYIGTDRVAKNKELESFDGFEFAEERIR